MNWRWANRLHRSRGGVALRQCDFRVFQSVSTSRLTIVCCRVVSFLFWTILHFQIIFCNFIIWGNGLRRFYLFCEVGYHLVAARFWCACTCSADCSQLIAAMRRSVSATRQRCNRLAPCRHFWAKTRACLVSYCASYWSEVESRAWLAHPGQYVVIRVVVPTSASQRQRSEVHV